MDLLKQLFRLPSSLDYMGYTFTLNVRKDRSGNLYLGYYLTAVYSQRKYKRESFYLGNVWLEKDRVSVSSVGSDYLFKVLILDDDAEAINALIELFKKHGVPLRKLEDEAIDTDFDELRAWIPQTLDL